MNAPNSLAVFKGFVVFLLICLIAACVRGYTRRQGNVTYGKFSWKIGDRPIKILQINTDLVFLTIFEQISYEVAFSFKIGAVPPKLLSNAVNASHNHIAVNISIYFLPNSTLFIQDAPSRQSADRPTTTDTAGLPPFASKTDPLPFRYSLHIDGRDLSSAISLTACLPQSYCFSSRCRQLDMATYSQCQSPVFTYNRCAAFTFIKLYHIRCLQTQYDITIGYLSAIVVQPDVLVQPLTVGVGFVRWNARDLYRCFAVSENRSLQLATPLSQGGVQFVRKYINTGRNNNERSISYCKQQERPKSDDFIHFHPSD